jgi:uncharacterized hydrophobic protein (TIGR00271 family)
MDELAITRIDHWAWRFTIMLTLSVVVAVMGLSADSAAVVIGAMLLAPLMTPVLASAACLSMSLVRKSFRSLLKVALATAWCIAIGYVISRLLPDGPLPGEVEARTRPDIRDLVVALAAGAAGAYATVRRDVSSSLPGVAVAVALVPPLGTVGITLEAGNLDLAAGALLLYVTNLAAIIFAGVMVFIATGFVPPRRLANTAVQLLVAAVVALAVVVVVAVPLYNRSAAVVERVQEEVLAAQIVDEWLGGLELSPEVDVQDGQVLVRLRGFDAPPDDQVLTQSLQRQLGDVSVLVEWVRTERATTTTTVLVELSDDDRLVIELEPIVQGWLADNDDAGADYELEEIEVVDAAVRIDVAGSGEPPSVEQLVDRIEDELGSRLSVRLNWTPRETITATTVAPNVQVEAEMRAVADIWAADVDVTVELLRFDGERVHLELIGVEPPDTNQLVLDLHSVAESSVPVDVFFTEKVRLTTTILVVDVFGGRLPTTTDPGGGAGATTTTTAAGGGRSATTSG